MNPAGRPGLVATWAALIVVYLIWGSTYLGIRVLAGFVPPLLGMGVRFLCAGILLAAGAVAGEVGRVHLAAVPPHAWLALAYLIVFGSLVAFSAYVWLLGNAPLSLIAIYAYVNPVVAGILGALILGEQVTRPILIGGAVVVAGVGLVVSVERPRRQATGPPGQADPPSPAMPRPAGPRASAKPSIRR